MEKMPSIKELKEEFLLNDEEIKTLIKLPSQEQEEFLIERKFRVTLMKALIESGADPEKAKEALTDPDLIEIVEVDERGNETKKSYH